MNTQKELNKIKKLLGTEAVSALKASKAILAGGALTSVFTGKEINDFDIYFRNFESLDLFLKNVYNKELLIGEDEEYADMSPYSLICVNSTNRSVLFSSGGENPTKIQLIHFGFYEEPEDIFESFDFTVNMAALDFADDSFVFHEDFFKDLAGRRLVINTKTNYPLITMLRLGKYQDRGYCPSKKEVLKLGLAVNNLKINSWEELEDQLSGFYGVDVSRMFTDKSSFSLDSAIEQLEKVEENLDHYFKTQNYGYYSLIRTIKNYHFMEETKTVFYKKLLQLPDGSLVSPYKNSFKWAVGEYVNGGEHGLWAYELKGDAEGHETFTLGFGSKSKCNKQVIATLEISPEDTKKVEFTDEYKSEVKLYCDVKLVSIEPCA